VIGENFKTGGTGRNDSKFGHGEHTVQNGEQYHDNDFD